MSDVIEIYRSALGVTARSKKDAREKALKRAHDVRKFEIDLYWKRANYFWLFQAAVFAAVSFTWRTGNLSFPEVLPIALVGLGTLTAWAGLLSAHSSKFWQRNWEFHIDMLESEFEGSLYKTVYVGRAGIKWSPTGLSERLSACFCVFWVILLLKTSFYFNENWDLNPSHLAASVGLLEAETILVWILTGVAVWWLHQKGGFQHESTISGVVSLDSETKGDRSWLCSPSLRSNRNEQPFLIQRGVDR